MTDRVWRIPMRRRGLVGLAFSLGLASASISIPAPAQALNDGDVLFTLINGLTPAVAHLPDSCLPNGCPESVEPISISAGPPFGQGFISPAGIAVDRNGDIIIADNARHRVYRLDHDTCDPMNVNDPCIVTTLPNLQSIVPFRVALAADGTIFFTDLTSGSLFAGYTDPVRRIDPETGVVETVFVVADVHNDFPAPRGIALDAGGNILFAIYDGTFGSIIRFDPVAGALSTDMNSFEIVASSELMTPVGIALDAAGNILVASDPAVGPGAIFRVDASTKAVSVVLQGGIWRNLFWTTLSTSTSVRTEISLLSMKAPVSSCSILVQRR